MDVFLETYILLKLNQEAAERLSKFITTSEIEAVIKKFLAHKSPGPDGFRSDLYQTFKEELTPVPLKLFQNSRRGKTPKLFF